MNVIEKYKKCIIESFIGPYKGLDDYEEPFKNSKIDFMKNLYNFLLEKNNDKKNYWKNEILNYCYVEEDFNCKGDDYSPSYIARGSYGIIYKFDENSVLKFPIVNIKYDDPLSKDRSIISPIPNCLKENEDYISIINFIEEQVTDIIIYCLYEDIINKYPNYIQCVPKVMSIIRFESIKNDGNYNICSIIEKLEPINFKKLPLKTVLGYLVQIANALYYLQKKFEFMHRDLHASNVMRKKNPNPDKNIKLCTGQILENQEYIISIIDFGNVSIKMDDLTINTNSTGLKDYNNHIFNKSHDLRMLFASLYLNETQLFDFMNPYFDIKGGNKEKNFFHIFYYKINEKNSLFEPKEVINFLYDFTNMPDY